MKQTMRKFLKSLWQNLIYALPSHPLIDRWIIRWHYFFISRRFPNLKNGQRFTEKIQRRKLFDHNPLLNVLQDKYESRAYVAERIGEEYLIPCYTVTEDSDSIDFSGLPDEFVIKPTHGSGWVILVEDKSKMDEIAIRKTMRAWLKMNYYRFSREWAYKDIEPRIMVEKLLHDDGKTGLPSDYKISCFSGEPRIFYRVTGRYTSQPHFLYAHIEGERLIAPKHGYFMVATLRLVQVKILIAWSSLTCWLNWFR
jgi:hypothetical protein